MENIPQVVLDWYERTEWSGPVDAEDNIERILCDRAGTEGHNSCGYCARCGAPSFHGCYCDKKE